LASCLESLWVRLKGWGRREEALAAVEETVGVYRELAVRSPDAYRQDLDRLRQVAAWLEHGEDISDASS
jgi:hypothetical protein